MKVRLAALMIGAALMGGSLIGGTPATAAEVTVGVNPGGIAFGYHDGYWDRARNWHAWRNQREMQAWRTENREHFHEWKHDRDKDHGWHDHDRYWEHRG